jgi:hypothetical protein
MPKNKNKNKPLTADSLFDQIKNQGIVESNENRATFKTWFETAGNLAKAAALTNPSELQANFPAIFNGAQTTGNLNAIHGILKNAANRQQQTSVINVIPIGIGTVRQENDMTNIKRLNDFLNQENLDQNLSSIKDKTGQLALDARGSFVITNTIANTFKSYKELLSQDDLNNLKVAVQGAFSDLSNNQSIVKKIMHFSDWFEGLGLSTQKKIIKMVNLDPNYRAVIDLSSSGKNGLNQAQIQSKLLQFITEFNAESKATRLLMVSYYFLGQTMYNSGYISSGSDDSDDSDNDPDVISTNPYKVFANDLSIAFDNAIGYIVASQLARKTPANTSSMPLSGLPKETQDDILTRYNIPQLMDLRRDQLFVANPLLIPNGYKDQDNMPLINPESDINRLDESNKILTKELEDLKRLMFGYSDALVNPDYKRPSSSAKKSSTSGDIDVYYLTPDQMKNQRAIEDITEMHDDIDKIRSNDKLSETDKHNAIVDRVWDEGNKLKPLQKKNNFTKLITETPMTSNPKGSSSDKSSSLATTGTSSSKTTKIVDISYGPSLTIDQLRTIYTTMNPTGSLSSLSSSTSGSSPMSDKELIEWATDLGNLGKITLENNWKFRQLALQEFEKANSTRDKAYVSDDDDVPDLEAIGGNPISHITSAFMGSDISSWTIPRGLI